MSKMDLDISNLPDTTVSVREVFGIDTDIRVPAYSKALEADGEEKADKLAGDAMATLAAATILITLVCDLAMPWLMYVINPGYASDPVKFKLDDGLKLEARNMSAAPVGAGPFMALVVPNRPAPTTSAPNLVRGL